MLERNSRPIPEPTDNVPSPESEGGLRAPPGLGSWGKAWWWFHFLILVKLARLRFIGILLAIGLVILKWDTLVAYYEKWTRPTDQKQVSSSNVEYFCPMHPTVIRDNPKDKCPICFMNLSKRKKGDGKEIALPPGIVNRVQLSPYRVVLAGIQTWQVAYVPLSKEITTVGFVEFNEREMKQVAARVKGRIDTLHVNETGQMVKAGEVLASLYSADLMVTVQNLLDAQASNNTDLQNVARNRLQLWGISDPQIDKILKSGKANPNLEIQSPIKGHVLKKYVKEGQYVEEGSPLYDVVDLSTVWIQAQVYEEDMAFLPTYHQAAKIGEDNKKGLPVTAFARSFPAEGFAGRLSFVYPHVDQETRTVVVRFELDNPGHKLRPGTSATVKLNVPPKQLEAITNVVAESWWQENVVDGLRQSYSPAGLAPALGLAPLLHAALRQTLLAKGLVLAVPESAVIDTGSQQIVYRQTAPGEFEGIKVVLGPRLVGADGVMYPVLRGLEAGDLVVTAGSFLVDAETRLNPAAGSIYYGGSGGGKSGQASAVRPSTPKDDEATVKAALAKLNDLDRPLAEAQGFCPVQKDSRLGLMGTPVKLMIQDQPVFLCCENCRKDALANPKETLAKVERLKRAQTASRTK